MDHYRIMLCIVFVLCSLSHYCVFGSTVFWLFQLSLLHLRTKLLYLHCKLNDDDDGSGDITSDKYSAMIFCQTVTPFTVTNTAS